MTSYSVFTDLEPEDVDDIALEIFARWVNFAMGKEAIGGHVLKHPTGRYAQSISVQRYGKNHVAIMADEEIAPEAQWIETGHAAVDFIAMFPGKTFKMHRADPNSDAGRLFGSAGYADPIESRHNRLQTGAHISSARRRTMWAEVRDQGETGYATVPHERTRAGEWMIPAMEAYSPAGHLSALFEELAQRRGQMGEV